MIEVYITRDEVERKVSQVEWCIEWVDDDVDSERAAAARAELATLRAENGRLREALRQLVENASTIRAFVNDPTDGILSGALYDTIINAKEALK